MSRQRGLDLTAILFGLFVMAIPWGDAGAETLPPWLSPTKLAFALFVLAFLAFRGADLMRLLGARDAWLAVLLAGGALSLSASLLLPISLMAFFRLLGMVVLFLLARSCLESESGRRVAVIGLVVAGTGQALLGIAQSLAARTWFGQGVYSPYQSLMPVYSPDVTDLALLYRAAGSFPHPNELGLFLVLTLAVTLGATGRSSRMSRLLLALSGLTQTVAVLYTCARSAWLGLLLVAAVLLARSPARRWILAILALGVVTGVALLPANGRQALLVRSARIQPYEASRLHYFRAAARMAISHPLTGVGLGTFAERFDDFKSAGVESDREQSSDAHNAFLALAGEAGIPAGLALLFGFSFTLITVIRRLIRHGPAPAGVLIPAAALSGTLASLLLNGFQYQEAAWLALAWAQIVPRHQPPPSSRPQPLPAASRLLMVTGAIAAMVLFALVAGWAGVERTLSGKVLLLEATSLGKRSLEHPRIHLDAVRVGELRRAAARDPERFRLLREWTGAAERQPALMPRNGDLRTLVRTIPPFAFSRLLFGRAEDLEQVRARLAALSSRWSPAQLDDLEIAEAVYALSLVVDWLRDDLTPEERGRILGLIRVGADVLRRQLWQYPPLNNHRVVDAACLGIAGLACYGDLPEAGGWIRRGLRELELCARFFSDDGVSPEGLGLATYVLEYLLKFDDAAGPLLDTVPLAETWQKAFPAAFIHQALPAASWTPDNLALSFGDSPRGAFRGPGYLAARLASRYGDPISAWLASESRYRGIDPPESAAWLNPLWRSEQGPVASAAGLSDWVYLENWGLYLTRDSWRDDATLLGFSCPPVGGRKLRRGGFAFPGLGHAHPEAGSFVLFSRGEHLVSHPGPTVKKLTADQNTILVNGRGQLGEGGKWFDGSPLFRRSRTPDLLRAEHTSRYDYLTGDVSPAYDPRELRHFVRHLLWLRPRVLCLLDELEADRPASFEWLLHSEGSIQRLDERSVRITRGRAALLVRVVWPSNAAISWKTEEVPGTSAPEAIKSWQTLSVRPQGEQKQTRFLVLLLPVDANEPSVFPQVAAAVGQTDIILPAAAGGGRIKVNPMGADRALEFAARP